MLQFFEYLSVFSNFLYNSCLVSSMNELFQQLCSWDIHCPEKFSRACFQLFYWRFETVKEKSSWTVWPLKMGSIGCLTMLVDCVWNVVAHAQKPDFVFRRKERVHLNRRGRQFSRLLAAEVCTSAVVMLDIPCSEVVWKVLSTHSNRQFPLHFPSRASPCAITFQLDSKSTNIHRVTSQKSKTLQGQCYTHNSRIKNMFEDCPPDNATHITWTCATEIYVRSSSTMRPFFFLSSKLILNDVINILKESSRTV